MSGGRWIALLDGGDGSAHKAFKKLLDVVVELAVLVADRRLRGERQRHPQRARRKWLHVFRNQARIRQPYAWVSLAIDELQHAQHFPFAVAHRKCKDRARAVAKLSVQVIVEAVGR